MDKEKLDKLAPWLRKEIISLQKENERLKEIISLFKNEQKESDIYIEKDKQRIYIPNNCFVYFNLINKNYNKEEISVKIVNNKLNILAEDSICLFPDASNSLKISF